jgi:hypothetical protein
LAGKSIIAEAAGGSVGWLPVQAEDNTLSLMLSGCSSMKTNEFAGRTMFENER